MKSIIITSLIVFTLNTNLFSQELLIGEERIEPGIVIIFEGAIKDHIVPLSMHLSENQTNIHIEARVNWDIKNIPSKYARDLFKNLFCCGLHYFYCIYV